MRVVLDTNVIISALIAPTGTPAKLLALWLDGLFDLVTSGELLTELHTVAGRPRVARLFRAAPEWVATLLALLAEAAIVVEAAPVDAVPRDQADNVVLGTAVAGQADYIVSGDEHLLALGAYQSILVVTPREFLTLLDRAPA